MPSLAGLWKGRPSSGPNHQSVSSTIVEWTTIQSRPSALRAHVLMCWVVSILPTTCWVDNTVRCGCLLAQQRTRLSSASGYGLGLGLFFGLASGTATGITLAIELNRAARRLDHYSLPWEGLFSAIRGFAFGAGLYGILGIRNRICHSHHSRPRIRLACVLLSIMQRLAVHGLRVVSFSTYTHKS
jgi:hypothetical protein